MLGIKELYQIFFHFINRRLKFVCVAGVNVKTDKLVKYRNLRGVSPSWKHGSKTSECSPGSLCSQLPGKNQQAASLYPPSEEDHHCQQRMTESEPKGHVQSAEVCRYLACFCRSHISESVEMLRQVKPQAAPVSIRLFAALTATETQFQYCRESCP
jgi:hypothetical protein